MADSPPLANRILICPASDFSRHCQTKMVCMPHWEGWRLQTANDFSTPLGIAPEPFYSPHVPILPFDLRPPAPIQSNRSIRLPDPRRGSVMCLRQPQFGRPCACGSYILVPIGGGGGDGGVYIINESAPANSVT